MQCRLIICLKQNVGEYAKLNNKDITTWCVGLYAVIAQVGLFVFKDPSNPH